MKRRGRLAHEHSCVSITSSPGVEMSSRSTVPDDDELRVGLFHPAGGEHTGAVLAEYRRRAPATRVRIVDVGTLDVATASSAGHVDIVLAWGPVDGPVTMARSNHEARPNRHTGELPAAVLAARGELAERKVLLDEQARERAAALLALKDPDFVGE